MKSKPYILLFYLSAAIIALLLCGREYGFRVSKDILAILIAIHFTAQVMNLVMKEDVSKLYAGLIIVGIIIGLVLVSQYASAVIYFILRYYLFTLIFIKGYLHKTAVYPKNRRVYNFIVLIVAMIGILLKIMHYPGANIAYLASHISLAVILISIGFYKANTPLEISDEVDQIGRE